MNDPLSAAILAVLCQRSGGSISIPLKEYKEMNRKRVLEFHSDEAVMSVRLVDKSDTPRW